MTIANLRRKVRLKTRFATAMARLIPRDTTHAPRRVLSSLPRSGTHWLKHMIAHSMGIDPLERRINGPEITALIDALENEAPRRLIYDHFDFDLHGSILTPAKYPRLKLIVLYRNPIDAFISQFYTRANNGTLPDPALDVIQNLRLYLTQKSKPHKTTWPLRDYLHRRVVGWLEAGYCLPVRYEDLVQDTPGQLARVLNYLEISSTPKTIQSAIEANQFKVLSGGRKPGEIDAKSHYRRGLPGEWREVVTPTELAEIEKQIGDYLTLMGYSLSFNS